MSLIHSLFHKTLYYDDGGDDNNNKNNIEPDSTHPQLHLPNKPHTNAPQCTSSA